MAKIAIMVSKLFSGKEFFENLIYGNLVKALQFTSYGYGKPIQIVLKGIVKLPLMMEYFNLCACRPQTKLDKKLKKHTIDKGDYILEWLIFAKNSKDELAVQCSSNFFVPCLFNATVVPELATKSDPVPPMSEFNEKFDTVKFNEDAYTLLADLDYAKEKQGRFVGNLVGGIVGIKKFGNIYFV